MPKIDGGSYWDLPSGKKRAQVHRKNHKAPTPKHRWESPVLKDLAAVRRWIRDVNDDLDAVPARDPDRSRVSEAQITTVADWWERWWPTRCEAGISPRYKEEMERRWRLHLQPRWGATALADLNSEDIQKWVNSLARGRLGAVYIEDIVKTLKTILTAAVDRRPQLLDHNPVYKIRMPEKSTARRTTLDSDDQALTIARRCGRFGIAVLTGYNTGLRPEELFGLLRTPTDAIGTHPYLPPAGPRVDPLRGALRIPYPDGALIEHPGGQIHQGPLKNRMSERVIRIPAFLGQLLAARLAEPADIRKVSTAGQLRFAGGRYAVPDCAGRPVRVTVTGGVLHVSDPASGEMVARHALSEGLDETRYVFTGPNGGVMRRSTFEPRFWRPACDGRPGRPASRGHAACAPWEAVCPGLEVRGLRHSHKKVLQSEGIPDFAIEARIGHSLKGISGVYSHVAEEVEDRIVRVLQRRWEHLIARLLEDADRARRSEEDADLRELAALSGVAA